MDEALRILVYLIVIIFLVWLLITLVNAVT
jgi:hypothetical protein